MFIPATMASLQTLDSGHISIQPDPAAPDKRLEGDIVTMVN